MKFDDELPHLQTEPKRAYRQGARALAAQASADRIAAAFAHRMSQGWFEEVRLEDVAQDAGVSVQTVIRRFGGKDGLLEAAVELMGREIRARRATAPGQSEAALRVLLDDYETTGDLVIRVLAQEDRHPAIRRAADLGRAGHRQWLAETFAPVLGPLSAGERERRLDALVVATDVYVWKLIRRDMGRSREVLAALMRRFIAAALAGETLSPFTPE